MLMLMVVVVALTTMTPTLHAAGLRVRADKDDADDEPLDLSHINPIDLCLFICQSCYDQVRLNRIKPNSITLASSVLAPNMFEAGSCQIPLH